MPKKNQYKELKVVVIAILACIVLLIVNVQCENAVNSIAKIEVSGGTDGPNYFKANEGIKVNYEVQLPTNYESYAVSVSDASDPDRIVKKWEGRLNANGAIKKSEALSGLDPGNYRATLTANPKKIDRITSPVNLPTIFHVANLTFLRIFKYSDANGNHKRDLEEIGVADGTFKYGKIGEAPKEGKTLEDGSIVLLDPEAGEYRIEEIPQEGWYSMDSEIKTINVSREKDNLVEFGDIQAGYVNITSFADLNGNDIKENVEYFTTGWSFTVTGDGFSQTFDTKGNGTNIALKPGIYTITEVQQNCWTATGETNKTVAVTPTETVSVSFGNKPQGSITMLAFQDKDKNGKYDIGEGVSGMTFLVSGSQGTKQMTSGNEGSAKYAGVPEVYSISANVPEEWILKSETNQTERINFCEDKQLMFEVTPRIIKIDHLVPENNAVLSSLNVSFTWSTSEISSGDLYIKMENQSNYTLVRGINGIDHFINRTNLIRNTGYNYFVRSEKDTRSAESEIRRFTVNNGVIFEPKDYNVEISRDYDQQCPIYVINLDSKPHSIEVNISSTNKNDIYIGFLGEGSADREMTLSPGEKKELKLVIHAQDAMDPVYLFDAMLTDLGPEKIVDYARIHAKVHINKTDFSIEQIDSDPINQTKTFSIKNLGDPIRDLSITPDENIGKNAVIQPLINHASLEKDEIVLFSVSPIWSNDIESIRGTLTASCGNVTKELDVDFSCEQGRSLFDVVIPRPLLHFDMNVRQCINAHLPIEGTFTLPPGLTEDNISSAKISYDLNVIGGLQTPYDVWTTINGREVGKISKDVFTGNYEFDIDPSYLKYTIAGSSLNRYSINDTMPQQYTTYLSSPKVLICLKELRLKICAENQQQADDIAERIPWIYKPPNRLNITILEPTEGKHMMLGTPTTIKVKVEGDTGGDRFSTVRAKSNNSIKGFRLVDNGQYEDGIYAATWVPDYPGDTSVKITASNCAVSGSKSISIFIDGDSNLADKDLMVEKSIDPSTLYANSYEEGAGAVIKYTIKVVPIGGKKLKDVKVVENLPNYMTLNNNSAIDRASIRLNHDGKKWSTTNVTWYIGDLDTSRFLTFESVFNWKIPADAQHLEGTPLPKSVVIYTGIDGKRNEKYIPEGEIRILASKH